VTDIRKADAIKGWMLPGELTWLAEQARRHQRILEVGSFAGRSTRALADNCQPGSAIFAVDTWEGSPEHLAMFPDLLDLWSEFNRNLADHVVTGRVTTWKMSSLEAANHFKESGQTFDMIFIDASHDYDSVCADLLAWRPLLKNGGLLCGHDHGRYSGLDRALRETLDEYSVMEDGSIWYVGQLDKVRAEKSSAPDREIKKTLYTLNVGNYSPEICSLTYPLLNLFADKCGARFYVINDRRFPDMPLTYEKLQIFELGRVNDWNIYFDSDALIHPDTFDPTEHLRKDTVMHNGQDMAGNRFCYDNYFRRDGRHIGSGNWFTVASNWCLDLWHPLDDLSLEEALDRIIPVCGEQANGITKDHLIDDYVLSRNIARYGLKYKTYLDLTKDLKREADEYFWHQYTIPLDEKLAQMKITLKRWGIVVGDTKKTKVKVDWDKVTVE
jgi:SAM-dependent methyltransferase